MSFFKAPSWARSQSMKAEGQSEKNIFSHSDNFLELQRERLEREEKRKAREKEKEEQRKAKQEETQRRSSSEKRKIKEEDGKGGLKKRRITAEESAKLLASAGLGDSITISDSEDDAQPQLPIRQSPRNTRTKDVITPAKPNSRFNASVHVDDHSQDDEAEITALPPQPAQPQSRPQPEPEEEVDSDPEIAELQRKARATARLKEQAKTAKLATPEVIVSSGIDEGDANGHLPTASLHDAAIQLLITSSIPETAPLIVWRKLSQSLRDVRKMWCKKQGFSEEFSKQVFLTHNGRRYYDSSTVQRLGISADADGRIFLDSDPTQEGVEKVAMEAMTGDMFEQLRQQKERQARADAGDYADEHQDADAGVEEEEAAPARRAIKLIVKAKNKKDYKVQVFNDTSFAKIIRAAKKDFGIASYQAVSLELDGEALDPDEQVGNTDLDDMDQVEMLVK